MSKAKRTDKHNKPDPHPFYGDNYIRGLDPWHRDAFPPEFRDRMRDMRPRREGWFLLDAYGNEIGFYPDSDSAMDAKERSK